MTEKEPRATQGQSGKPTIQSVADAVGVSTATVSRCMNHPDRVKRQTLQRVRTAVRELGYVHPEPASRTGPRLAREKRSPQTVMLLWTEGEIAQSSDAQLLLHGVMAGTRRHGMALVVDRLEGKNYIPTALANGDIDGLLLHGPEPDKSIAAVLRTLPSVWLFQGESVGWGDRVQPDHRGLGALAYDHLVADGASDLCCITSQPCLPAQYYTSRANAFIERAALAGTPSCRVIESPFAHHNNMEECKRETQRALRKFLKLRPRPDGLFVAHHLGSMICRELTRNGIQPGQDLHVVVGDNEQIEETADLPIARTEIFPEDIGSTATDMLMWRISNPNIPRITHLMAPMLRTTTV
jgi:LacI family transcriptional regulator